MCESRSWPLPGSRSAGTTSSPVARIATRCARVDWAAAVAVGGEERQSAWVRAPRRSAAAGARRRISPRRRRFSSAATPARKVTESRERPARTPAARPRSASGSAASSTGTTRSAPAGTGAPVMMRAAAPAGSAKPGDIAGGDGGGDRPRLARRHLAADRVAVHRRDVRRRHVDAGGERPRQHPARRRPAGTDSVGRGARWASIRRHASSGESIGSECYTLVSTCSVPLCAVCRRVRPSAGGGDSPGHRGERISISGRSRRDRAARGPLHDRSVPGAGDHPGEPRRHRQARLHQGGQRRPRHLLRPRRQPGDLPADERPALRRRPTPRRCASASARTSATASC